MHRYHRQIILPQIGIDGQKKLLESKVLIIGAGGLGHPVAQYLATMGVGELKIVDGDKVNLTNLHRQTSFDEDDIGKIKSAVLAEKISRCNSEIRVSFEPIFLDKKRALKLFPEFNLVVDCTDNFNSKYLINDVCALLDKPYVYGAISQFEGQVGVFWQSKGSCYRCLFPNTPKSNVQNCSEAGVVGPVVGIIGALQAMEAMKVLIGKNDLLTPLIGRVNFYNFCDHSLRGLKISRRQGCRCHQESFHEDDILDDTIESGICSSTLLVDVREKEEWQNFHIEGSYSLPLSELEGGYCPKFSSDQEIVLICCAGVRAKRAQELLSKMNFKKVQFTEKSVYEYQT